MSEAKSLQYKLSLTNEEMVAMIDKLTAAKNNLNGKATDFSKADELLEEYNNRDNNQRYHNATAPSQLAYDNAINELKNKINLMLLNHLKKILHIIKKLSSICLMHTEQQLKVCYKHKD